MKNSISRISVNYSIVLAAYLTLIFGVVGCSTTTRVYPGGYLDPSDYTRMQKEADTLRVAENRPIWERTEDHLPMPDYVYWADENVDFSKFNVLYLVQIPSNDNEEFNSKFLELVREKLLDNKVFKSVEIISTEDNSPRVQGLMIADKSKLTVKKILIGGSSYLQYEFQIMVDERKAAAIQVISSNTGIYMGFGLVRAIAGSLESRTAELLYRVLKEIKYNKKGNAVHTKNMPPAYP